MSNTLPQVARARGYHLYDRRRRRYLDMFLNDGRALLGHRPEALSAALKNVISLGLYAEYPSAWSGRAGKTLELAKDLFGAPDHQVRVFRNEDRALAIAARWRGGEPDPAEPRDPVLPEAPPSGGPRIVLWRPLCRPGIGSAEDIILPVLPFPGRWAPAVVLFPPSGPGPVPPSDQVAAPLLEALIRAVHDAGKLSSWEDLGGFCGPIPSLWRRNGPYLVPACTADRYPAIFSAFSAAGIILNPRFSAPSILPINWSDGERKLFLRTSRELSEESDES